MPIVEPGIEKARGVCGGAARIARTRIPVWQLVEARDRARPKPKFLPISQGCAEDLVNAWVYEKSHRDEIRSEIHENEVA